MPAMRTLIAVLLSPVIAASLAGCGYVDAYEEGVAEYEPIYCYRALADISCYREPVAAEDRRLVNYYGSHPSRYDAPPLPPAEKVVAPPAVDYFVRDPDPVPRPKGAQPGVPLTDASAVPSASVAVSSRAPRSAAYAPPGESGWGPSASDGPLPAYGPPAP